MKNSTTQLGLTACLCFGGWHGGGVRAFVIPSSLSHAVGWTLTSSSSSRSTALHAAGGGKKKRRRRKTAPVGSAAPATEDAEVKGDGDDDDEEVKATTPKVPVINSQFSFDRNEAIALGITDAEEDENIIPAFAPPSAGGIDLTKGAVELPTFGDAMKKNKRKKDAPPVDEDEEEDDRDRIDRGDISSFKKLLEVEPNADTDASFFEAEEYGIVSALLAEGSRPFLGIPSGPLQVGHFIGALVVVLMAFVEYPGFPLTNLPSPLRGALQGGLGTIYTINVVLAIVSTFQAAERNQPKILWATKCLTVGGLAYDQLTQLPTTKQIEERKAKKGRRALKKKNKK